MNPDIPITGVYVAAVTPHRKGSAEADIGATLELVDFLANAGVNGIALLGSTGEFLHLTSDDRVRLVQLAVKRSRIPVLAGVGHSTLDGAIAIGREAASAGAAGLLLMPPYFFRYSQEDIREFYMQFVAAMDRSARIFLYNIPFFTNEITPATSIDLLSTGQFAGIKDSSGEYEHFEKLLELSTQNGLTVLIGNDRIFTRARKAGAHGIVSGVACAVPELLVALDRAIQNNRENDAQRLDAKLQEFIGWHDQFPTPVAIKIAAAERGLTIGPLAVPLGSAGQKRLEEFREWFRNWLPEVQKDAVRA